MIGKAVVPEDEAYARIQAAVDARHEGVDIWILGRTDSLIHGYEEALKRARRFIEIGVDAVFIEAVPDRATMERFVDDLNFPMVSVYSSKALPFSLVATKISQSDYYF